MGAYWLHDIGPALTGLPAHYYDGWETRSRSSGGFDRILGIAVHHTASSATPDSDMNYMWRSSSDRPIGNIYLARDGQLWVGTAGASNTQGKGGPLNCSNGQVPKDAGNKFMIAIEAANNGVGESWPKAQTDIYTRLVRQLADHYALDVSRDVYGHYDYCAPSCPGRKVDPAGPSPFGSVNASQTWDINKFRAAVLGQAPGPGPGPGPGPSPQPQGDDNVPLCVQCDDGDAQQNFATFALVPGISIGWITSQTQVDVGRITGTLIFNGDTGEPLNNFGHEELQSLIDRYWSGGPKPPGFH